MSFIGSLFGQNGSGANWKAEKANLMNPSTIAQADTTYAQSQDALKQQQDFLAALQAQGGIQNQSDVYNQMQGVANGTGPNPAQAMLANATGNNVANQAALMAGQRGSAANAGLIARQAGQQGGSLQQQAAGQGAALQAQQSLNALNTMGGMAGQQVGQQQQATGDLNRFAQAGNQTVLNSIDAQNRNAIANIAQANQANSGMQQMIGQQQGQMLGGLFGGIGSGLGMGGGGPTGQAGAGKMTSLGSGGAGSGPQTPMAGAAHGGAVSELPNMPASGPRSYAGRHLTGYAKGGQVEALVSPGEVYLPPSAVREVAAKGNKPGQAIQKGEKIPGKAKVSGDSYANDTVHKSLQAGGIVIPKHVMESDDAPAAAAKFVQAILARKGLPKRAK